MTLYDILRKLYTKSLDKTTALDIIVDLHSAFSSWDLRIVGREIF